MSSEQSKSNPWIIGLVTLFLSPIIGMCYINKGRLAFLYLIISIVLSLVIFFIIPLQSASELPYLIINIIGAVHCFTLAKKQPSTDPLKWYAHWWVPLGLFLGFPLFSAYCFRTFLYEPFHLPSASMSPSANFDDYLFVEKFAYNTHTPERGDVIVFKNPLMSNANYIKRVIGLPGDKVQIKGGIVYINDIATVQRRIEDFDLHTERGEKDVPQFIEILPEGKEHRILMENTAQPDENTPVYVVPEQQYFVLGDNRNQSVDSRSPDKVGFVSKNNIIGKAVEIVWNYHLRKLDPKPVQ